MGRDNKAPKQPSKPVAEASVVEPIKQKPPKGHRQKGAGTIVTAPPTITTADGVTLAPHMKLPTLILQEYCQKHKREKPQYELIHHSHQFKCKLLLPDKKSSKHDLQFLPLQFCDSEKSARDFAALLALLHFQANIPLDAQPDTKSLAPPPILGLKATEEFSSVAAKQLAEDMGRVKISKEQSQLDAFLLSNSDCSVALSAISSQSILRLLGEGEGERGSPSSSSMQLDMKRVAEFSKESKASDACERKLVSLGWPQACCTVAVCLAARQAVWHLRNSVEYLAEFALELLCQSALVICGVPPPTSPPGLGAPVELVGDDAFEAEVEVLQAIFGDDLSIASAACGGTEEAGGDSSTSPRGETALTVVTIQMSCSCADIPQKTILLEMRVRRRESPWSRFPFLPCFRLLDSSPLSLLPLQMALISKVLAAADLEEGWMFRVVNAAQEVLDARSDNSALEEQVRKLQATLEGQLQSGMEAAKMSPENASDSTTSNSIHQKSVPSETSSGGERGGGIKQSDCIADGLSCTPKASPAPPRAPSFWSSPAIPSQRRSSEVFPGRANLPAWSQRGAFADMLHRNQAILCVGNTGCGKTTQMPQFIIEGNASAKVVVCQPRRLAAVTVAQRVAQEQHCSVGELVGYAVRGQSKVSSSTRLMFCTYGVLLRVLLGDPELCGVTHVVLDEVHERGVESDFALTILLDAVRKRRSSSSALKLVIMSATIQTGIFADYIRGALDVEAAREVVLTIPGRTFPVQMAYLDDFEGAVYDGSEGNIKPWVKRGDINFDLLVRLIMRLRGGKRAKPPPASDAILCPASGCVLVFLPGVGEISKLVRRLEQALQDELPGEAAGRSSVMCLPLHSGLSPSEQKRVFEPTPTDTLRVVAATNIAEASITIPDVTVVIDSCKVKEFNVVLEEQMTSLVTRFVSKDSADQRAGRAGRVQSGRCFRLVHKSHFESFPTCSTPEILRISLDQLVLQLQNMFPNDQRCVAQILARCISPPPPAAVDAAYAELLRIGALVLEGEALALTALGNILSSFPCSPRIGKLLVFGVLLGCLSAVSAVAACASTRSPFMSASDDDMARRVERTKHMLTAGFGTTCLLSDQLLDGAAVMHARKYMSDNKPSPRAMANFCRELGLSADRMQECLQTQDDLLHSVCTCGILDSAASQIVSQDNIPVNSNSLELPVVLAALCGGLYPSVCRVVLPPKLFAETKSGAMLRDAAAEDMRFVIPVLENGVACEKTDKTENAESSSSSDKEQSDEVVSFQSIIQYEPDSLVAEAIKRVCRGMVPVSLHRDSLFAKLSPMWSRFLVFGSLSYQQANANNGGGRVVSSLSHLSPAVLALFARRLEYDAREAVATTEHDIALRMTPKCFTVLSLLRSRLITSLETLHSGLMDKKLVLAIFEFIKSSECS